MALGKIPSIPVTQFVALSPRVTNLGMHLYIPYKRPYVYDAGLVVATKRFSIFAWNGEYNDTNISSTSAVGDILGITPVPTVSDIQSESALRIDFTIVPDGPMVFDATYTFNSSEEYTPLLRIIGTRPPPLSGDVGYIFYPHNWESGLDERLEWKTDVLIAYDRTEQRFKLRAAPRRTWEYRLTAKGQGRNLLESWLSMRYTKLLFAPIWRDLVQLTAQVTEGTSLIPVVEGSDNYTEGTPIAIWSPTGSREIKTIECISSGFITVDTPFTSTWPKGSYLAPCRYFLGSGLRKVSRVTDEVGDYRLSLQPSEDKCTVVSYALNLFMGVEVCPFTPSFENGDEVWENKWEILDNDTGVLTYDIQSTEPVITRSAKFVVAGTTETNKFMAFIHDKCGKHKPFWLPATDRGFELAGDVSPGSTTITIKNIGYTDQFTGCNARSYIELETYSGVVYRRQVISSDVLPSLDEQLTLDTPLPNPIAINGLRRSTWLEKVRFDSDTVTLHWETNKSLTTSIPIVVLP